MSVRLPRLLLLPLVAALLVAVTGCASNADVANIPHYTMVKGKGLGPAKGSVTQLDGSTWSYAKPSPGSITLLYFGYTSCPDVCPSTMADIAVALTRLPPDVRSKVWVQFVSTDPDRDTPQQLRTWVDGFDKGFHAGRADMAQVIADAQAYGVGVEAPKQAGANYQVTHGALTLVLNPKGEAVGYFGELAGHAAYEAGLPILVKKYA